jgi:hypothetical protein
MAIALNKAITLAEFLKLLMGIGIGSTVVAVD